MKTFFLRISIKKVFLFLCAFGPVYHGHAYYTEQGEQGGGALLSKEFSGGYVGCSVGISHQNTEGTVNLGDFSLESGSEDEDIIPEGGLVLNSEDGVGRYFVTHKFSDMENFNLFGGTLSFVLDFRGGYRFAAGKFFLLGIEGDFIYRSGHGARCSTTLSGQQSAELNNFQQGNVLQVPTDISPEQNAALLSSIDENDDPLKVVVENKVNFDVFVQNNWILEISGLLGIVIDRRCLLNVKVGAAFLSWTLTSGLSGSYGSSGYFVDQFAGGNGASPQTISWSWEAEEEEGGPVLKTLENISDKYRVWNVGLLVAPSVEVSINPQLSFFLEPKIIFSDNVLSKEGELITPHEAQVPYSATFHSAIIIGTIGFRFKV